MLTYEQFIEEYRRIESILTPEREYSSLMKPNNKIDNLLDSDYAMWKFFESGLESNFSAGNVWPDMWKGQAESLNQLTETIDSMSDDNKFTAKAKEEAKNEEEKLKRQIVKEGNEWFANMRQNLIIQARYQLEDFSLAVKTINHLIKETKEEIKKLKNTSIPVKFDSNQRIADGKIEQIRRKLKENEEKFNQLQYDLVIAITAQYEIKKCLASLKSVSIEDIAELNFDLNKLMNEEELRKLLNNAAKIHKIKHNNDMRHGDEPTNTPKDSTPDLDGDGSTPTDGDDDKKKVPPVSDDDDDKKTKPIEPNMDNKKRFEELKNKLEIGIITKIELEEFRILVVKYIEEIRVNINVIEEMYINLALSKNDILLGVISVEQLDEFKLLYVKVKNGEKLTDEESIKFESYRKILIKVGVKIQQNVTINTYNVNVFIGNYDELLKQIEILEKLIIDIDIKIRTFVDSNKYTVTFDGNGGKFVDDSTIKRTTVPGGSIVGKPDDPVLDGDHEFDTWVKDDGTPFDFNTPITEDVNLKAKYREKTKKFKVVYNAAPGVFADGTDTKTVEVFPTTISPNPGNPNLPDNDFIGWTFNGTPFDITNTPITQDMELKANYRKRYYVVKFVQEDGTVLETYKVPKDQPLLELPPERGKDGKLLKRLKFKNGEYKKCKTTRLDGWVEGNGVDPFDFSQPITHDIEFKPKYRFNWEKIASIGVGLGVAITAGALAPEALAFATAKAVAATSLVTGGIGIVGKNLSEKYGAKKKLITGAKAPSNILKNACRRIYNETIANPYFWDDLVHANAASALIGIGNAIKNRPIPDPVPVPEWQDVDYDVVVTEDSTTFNGIDYNNAVYRSPEDALNGTNPFNAIKNIWKAGEEHIYKLEYKDSIGNWIETSKGSTLDEVMKQLPAGVNPEEVAVHAWSKDGGMLGFQKLSDCITTIKGTTDWAQTAQNAFDAFKAANGANFSVEEIKNKIIESLVGKGCARDLAEDVVVKLSSGRTM